MNKEKLKEFLADYNNKDITVFLEGSVETYFTIHKAQIFVGYSTLLIANDTQEIKIDLDEVTYINYDNGITLNVESEIVVIDS